MTISMNINSASVNSDSKLNYTNNNLSLNNDKNYINKNNDNLSNYSRKHEDVSNFKKVLDSKTTTKPEKSSHDAKELADGKIQDSNTNIEDKIKELKEEIKKSSNEDIVNILNNILTLLNKDEAVKVDDEQLNSEILNVVIEGLNKKTTSNNDLVDIITKMLETSKNDSLGDVLTKDTKSLMEALLNQVGETVSDKSEVSNSKNNTVKDLIAELSNVLGKTEEKVSNFSNIFKDFSQSKGDNLTNQSNLQENKKIDENASKSDEDNFLNNLIDNKKEDGVLNKINLLAPRNQEFKTEFVSNVEGTTVNKVTIGDDLIKNIKFMTTNAMKELTVKLNPKELGQLTISLIQENGMMKATIKAQSKETYELISQNLLDIKKSLGEQNIKIADVNIELYQDDTTFFMDKGFNEQLSEEQGKNNQNNNKTSNINLNEVENEEIEDISNNNLDFLA
ncbi:flagellar hook-length control protein FliK [Clostridium weizhouense]|uniref:Flagellar hook-length control protein FliK n=1 Tax=Clostridium weizhouense TaxID=2859781 RepID=A0ABS7AIS0_9CLOT|nr:flagellar hook-length control protein FliK [Clostridium weizhouense]MBW6408558.1 flagellar hook-length control protein FliK [Clostridium weizhouense]